MHRNFYLPYLLNYKQPVTEDIVIFCVAVLLAILVSAEGQAFAATLLGDSRIGAKDRFHFNVFMHMSLLGTLNFFVAGFGWTRQIDIDQRNFANHPRLFFVLSRLAGPLANFMMANIAGSLSWLLGIYNFDDKVFSTIVVVNITMAVYGLIIVPPLPGSAVLLALLPDGGISQKIKKTLILLGPYLIISTFLIIRLSGWEGISNLLNPVVSYLAGFILEF